MKTIKLSPKYLPPVVSEAKWKKALAKQIAKEKKETRARDRLAAQRRRLPMVQVEKDYVFAGPKGKVSLVDLFEGRSQLILYHFMFSPDVHGWPWAACPGCSLFADNLGHPAHLNARDVTRAMVSRAPLANISRFKKRMGWTVPWYSSNGTDFNKDFGVTPPDEDGETFGLSVFLRDGDKVYRTYYTDGRGTEALGSSWTFLDLTPFGRQETWEDSPKGFPQGPLYSWWRLHDDYAKK
jgi:predicted dithiol-disulfide oxidoreductase (DUF899 family)